MLHRRKQFIALAASLLILLAQFVVVVHASEHPFHHEDILCLSFQSAQQDKHCAHSVPALLSSQLSCTTVVALSTEKTPAVSVFHYSSRAPPKATI